MTNDKFLQYFSLTLDKKTAQAIAHEAVLTDGVRHVIDFTFHQTPEVAFRAAWVLEHCFLRDRKCMVQNLHYFLDAYVKQSNKSCQRHYTKIMMYLSEKGQVHLLGAYNLLGPIETTFEWLINPATPVAVQVNCMDVLFNLRTRCDWIEEELKAQIIFLLKDGTAAMQSRGKKLLNKLK